MAYFNTHGVRGILLEGRIIAYGRYTTNFLLGGTVCIVVRLPDLKYVETVIEYKFHSDPIVSPGIPTNERITGNVVGVTLVGVGAGTTLTVEVVAVGTE